MDAMEHETWKTDVVDPEVRAYVYSLVTALGGRGADDEDRYVLGDDALAVLKDIKKWLKLYDDKLNRLDVARCLAEANLVNGDLLEILAAWPEDAREDKLQHKTALSCLEVLTPLTWPIEKVEYTVNHYRHMPFLQLSQIGYKREILEHPSGSTLRTAISVALPSIALPIGERSQRDEGIIRLVLYFLRNVAIISAPDKLPVEWNEKEVSRSATIDAFREQDVFELLLTISSNMGEDFGIQDVIVLEVLFHLLKGINVETLFLDDDDLSVKGSRDLKGLMTKEANMLRSYSKNAPTRHNRFGTMIWVQRDDHRVSNVSGQDVLSDPQRALSKIDQSKKWSRPKRTKREERTTNHFDKVVPLSSSARKHLRAFVEDFLDAGFNPLFNHIRRAIEREAERVLDSHSEQFFFLVSWFLEAQRRRIRVKSEMAAKSGKKTEADPDNYGIIASVLNQETFILLNRFMQSRIDDKTWFEVNAGMRAFTQILMTVHDMSESPLEEDQEIAENIQNRIFYEETTHDRVLAILRGYQTQGFSYLDACTQLAHVFLRLLEKYSRENGDLQIRSRRRARKKRKEEKKPADDEGDADQESEAEDEAEAQRISAERKFDFKRFATKFVNQHCVDTFVAFTSYYRDLTDDQLKRAHRFFYRVAFKQETSVMLFRLDIIKLFHQMVKGPDPLACSQAMCKEWEEFAKQLIRRMIKKLDQRPELFVELLFSKINATTFYLEYGYEKQTVASKPREAAELEIKGELTKRERIGIAIAVMRDEKMDKVEFVKSKLSAAASERQAWEAEADARRQIDPEVSPEQASAPTEPPAIAITPSSDAIRLAMLKDPHLRLLMCLAGFERREDSEDNVHWSIPPSITVDSLKETLSFMDWNLDNPQTTFGDSEDLKEASEMIRRKSAVHKRAAFDDDDEDDGFASLGDEEFLFPAGGPTARKSDALEQLKQKRLKRRRSTTADGEEIDEAELAARRKRRKLAELEKRRKIKSAEVVHSSDDETDEEQDREFFANEARQREGWSEKITTQILKEKLIGLGEKREKKKRTKMVLEGDSRKSAEESESSARKSRVERDAASSDSAGDMEMYSDDALPQKKAMPSESEAESSDSEDDKMIETPITSDIAPLRELAVNIVGSKTSGMGAGDSKVALADDSDEDIFSGVARRRQRAILEDSDDE